MITLLHIILILFFLCGIVFFFTGLSTINLKRLVENTPTSKIRGIAMGLVEIFGKVKIFKDHIIISPISKQPCVYYEHLIYGYHAKTDPIILRQDSGRADYFIVKDNTGEVIIRTEGAQLNGYNWDGENKDHCKKGELTFEEVSKIGIDRPFIMTGNVSKMKRFTYYERYIKEGDLVYVMGEAGDNPFIEEGTAQKGAEDIMISRGDYRKAFYISNNNERGVLKGLGLMINMALIGGAVLSIVCLTMLFYLSIA